MSGTLVHVFVWMSVFRVCPVLERFPNGPRLLEGCSKAGLLLPWLLYSFPFITLASPQE